MEFFHFGGPDRPLFGALHPAQTTARATAVLLVNPFGEEAIRAHRIYRVLALRLSRAGFPVMRFDHAGTGDSAGDAKETTVDDWVDGISSAKTELVTRSHAKRVAMVGLRLGGTLAVLAAKKHPSNVHHLLLWDPVISGSSYLKELAAAHVEYMTDEMGAPASAPSTTADGYPLEALGHPLPLPVVAALSRIDLVNELSSASPAEHLTALTTRESEDTRRLEERVSRLKNGRFIATSTNIPWNSDAAVNSAVVPMDILDKLVARIQELDT